MNSEDALTLRRSWSSQLFMLSREEGLVGGTNGRHTVLGGYNMEETMLIQGGGRPNADAKCDSYK